MLRKATLAGSVTVSSVAETRAEEEKGSLSLMRFLANVIDESEFDEAEEALNEVGERKKSRDHFLRASLGGVVEPFWRSSVSRLAVRGRAFGSGGKRMGSIGSNVTDGSFMSSRTSLMVNEACIGPLRPITRTLLTLLLENVATACSVISVLRRRSISHSKVRAISRATLPCPTTIASSPVERSGARLAYSGRPLYQPTKARAEYIPLRLSSPVIPSLRSFEAP